MDARARGSRVNSELNQLPMEEREEAIQQEEEVQGDDENGVRLNKESG